MLIKPIDLAELPGGSWQNKAGNTYFTLQSKSQDSAILSFFSNTLNTKTLGSSYTRSISHYDFRIILALATRNQKYVVAVAESFAKIHDVYLIECRIGTLLKNWYKRK
jgi:hypothetical protein